MNGMLKLLILSLTAFIVLAAVDYWMMPTTVPVGWGTDSQPLWQVETAFLLRALENISATIAVVIVLLAGVFYIRRRLRPDTQF